MIVYICVTTTTTTIQSISITHIVLPGPFAVIGNTYFSYFKTFTPRVTPHDILTPFSTPFLSVTMLREKQKPLMSRWSDYVLLIVLCGINDRPRETLT